MDISGVSSNILNTETIETTSRLKRKRKELDKEENFKVERIMDEEEKFAHFKLEHEETMAKIKEEHLKEMNYMQMQHLKEIQKIEIQCTKAKLMNMELQTVTKENIDPLK